MHHVCRPRPQAPARAAVRRGSCIDLHSAFQSADRPGTPVALKFPSDLVRGGDISLWPRPGRARHDAPAQDAPPTSGAPPLRPAHSRRPCLVTSLPGATPFRPSPWPPVPTSLLCWPSLAAAAAAAAAKMWVMLRDAGGFGPRRRQLALGSPYCPVAAGRRSDAGRGCAGIPRPGGGRWPLGRGLQTGRAGSAAMGRTRKGRGRGGEALPGGSELPARTPLVAPSRSSPRGPGEERGRLPWFGRAGSRPSSALGPGSCERTDLGPVLSRCGPKSSLPG